MHTRMHDVKAGGMHPVTHRLYEAVQVLIRSSDWPQQARVASEANISSQTLNNWEMRGPSAQGLLDFQLTHGVSATWLLTGRGPMLMGGSTKRAHVAERHAEYRIWPLSEELLKAIAELPAEARSRVENGLRGQLGLPPAPAPAGNRSAA